MFSYSVVEGALAEFFGVRPKGQPAMRSRVRNLQRLGLIPEKAGNRLLYTKYDVYDLALALSLAEFGVEPRYIVASNIPNFIRDLDKTGKWKKDQWVCMYSPKAFSSDKAPQLSFLLANNIAKVVRNNPRIAFINLKDLIERVDASLQE